MSFMFSSASAALLNGEKLNRETILLNFARSLIESWTAFVREPTSSCSLTSNTAYPDADSKRRWVAIVALVVGEDECKFWPGKFHFHI